MTDVELNDKIADNCDQLAPLLEERKRRFDAVAKYNSNGEAITRKTTVVAYVMKVSGGEALFEVNEHLVGRDSDLLDLVRARYGFNQSASIDASKKKETEK